MHNNQANKLFDIIAFGQSTVYLQGEQSDCTLKDMISFKKYVGGTAATLAIGCARLGQRTAMGGILGNDELGDFIANALQQEKIDISAIKRLPHFSTPLRLGTPGSFAPPHTPVSFECEKLCDPLFISQSQALLIAASDLTESHFNHACRAAVIAAKAHQNDQAPKVILVLDQWGLDQQETPGVPLLPTILQSLLPLCDLVIAPLAHPDHLGILQAYTDAQVIAGQVTAHGSEAFTAGFLNAWLRSLSVEQCLAQGQTAYALVQSRPANSAALPSGAEMALALSEQKIRPAPLAHLHYATTRPASPIPFYAFSFGLDQSWQSMAEKFLAPPNRVQQAKQLVASGIAHLAQLAQPVLVSVCTEDNFNQHALHSHFPHAPAVIRAIEKAGSVPLQFEAGPEMNSSLCTWPKRHMIKVGITYHPDDRYVLRTEQEAMLHQLYRAARHAEHELLIEITPASNNLITSSTFAHIMQRFYDIEIYPDWWQMQTPRDQRSWDSITRVLEDYDPHCRGVLITTPQPTLMQIETVFQFNAKQKPCQGFVLTKNFLQPYLEQWFKEEISDHHLSQCVTENLERIIAIWEKAKHLGTQMLPQNIIMAPA